MGTGLPLRKRLAGGVTKRQQGHAVAGFGPCRDDEITLVLAVGGVAQDGFPLSQERAAPHCLRSGLPMHGLTL